MKIENHKEGLHSRETGDVKYQCIVELETWQFSVALLALQKNSLFRCSKSQGILINFYAFQQFLHKRTVQK